MIDLWGGAPIIKKVKQCEINKPNLINTLSKKKTWLIQNLGQIKCDSLFGIQGKKKELLSLSHTHSLSCTFTFFPRSSLLGILPTQPSIFILPSLSLSLSSLWKNGL